MSVATLDVPAVPHQLTLLSGRCEIPHLDKAIVTGSRVLHLTGKFSRAQTQVANFIIMTFNHFSEIHIRFPIMHISLCICRQHPTVVLGPPYGPYGTVMCLDNSLELEGQPVPLHQFARVRPADQTATLGHSAHCADGASLFVYSCMCEPSVYIWQCEPTGLQPTGGAFFRGQQVSGNIVCAVGEVGSGVEVGDQRGVEVDCLSFG
mmetsp:Transcript_18277/g.8501  ORF Transcript_18277/g.8501 Transcript_18277/m.8501 type:complete len:206 (-) Transcript_18277:39-656(-)